MKPFVPSLHSTHQWVCEWNRCRQRLGFKGNTEEFAKHTLAKDVPWLSAHLFAGAQVPDVGCGSGSITLDVAAAVVPGRVIGIDVMEDRISEAAKLASDRGVGNASFDVGDCHVLRFPDDTGDSSKRRRLDEPRRSQPVRGASAG